VHKDKRDGQVDSIKMVDRVTTQHICYY